MINKQIYLTSLTKALNGAKRTGTLDLEMVNLFGLVDYYVNFTKDKVEFNDQHIGLKKLLAELKHKYPQELCTYKTIITNKDKNKEFDSGGIYNSPPNVDDNVVNIYTNAYYKLKPSDFLLNYSDPNRNGYDKVNINFGTLEGKLYKGASFDTSSLISGVNIEMDLNKPFDLYYVRPTNDTELSDILSFRVSDLNSNSYFSSKKTLTIIRQALLPNQPPVIGDIVITPPNRVTTTITLAMLTTLLTPPYNDPEGDLLDAIRIDALSIANKGKYLLNGLEVVAGVVIYKEDIENGLFTHQGANVNDISTDIFLFSARDEGSGIWVQ